MKTLIFTAMLLSLQSDCFAAKLLSMEARSYLPYFGIGSTSSVVYTTAQGSVSTRTVAPLVDSRTELLRILTTTDTYMAVGSDPIPTVANMVVPANVPIILEVLPTDRIGVIQKATAGALYVTRIVTYPSLD